MKNILIAAAALMLAGCGTVPAITAEGELESPNGELQLTFGLIENGTPAYTLEYRGDKMVEVSRLGFDLTDGSSLKDGFSVTGVDFDAKDETWEPVWGEERQIRNNYKEMLATLEKESGEVMCIRFRL